MQRDIVETPKRDADEFFVRKILLRGDVLI